MGAPFSEAHQFKGVHGAYKHAHEVPSHIKDSDVIAKLLAVPHLGRDHALEFSDGTFFEVQTGVQGQYLLLASGERVEVGEWICQLNSGRFIKLTDEEYHDMGGKEESK